MKNLRLKKQTGKTLGGIKRKSLKLAPGDLVELDRLPGGRGLPLVIRPTVEGVDLLAWAADNDAKVEDLLWKHSALLFRGFGITTVEAFEDFVRRTSNSEPLAYRDRTTPRTTKGNRVYTSTIHPADQRINPHNEGTYWLEWPLKLYLCCIQAAVSGGETPLVDVRKVYAWIDPEIRAKFEAKNMMLVRNYNDGFGLTWQEVYQTDNKVAVETYCRENAIEFEWKRGDRLRTHCRTISPSASVQPAGNDNSDLVSRTG